jgi:hypothetical protein
MFARLATILAAALLLAGTARAEMHLIYLHGCCIRDLNDPKVAAYEAAVEEFRREGFVVSFDVWTADVGDSQLGTERKVAALAGQVLALIDGGTFAEDITVVGHGLGATVALVASGMIQNRRVNYALLGGCPATAAPDIDYAKVMGRFLVLTDAQDKESGSCHGRFPEHVFYKESSVTSPADGPVFLRSDGESLRLWRDPVVSFVTGKWSRRGR